MRANTILATIVLGVLCVAGRNVPADEPVTGRFALTDHHGNAVTEASYDGRYRLVFFGFTRCPVICPTTMLEVSRVMNRLGDRSERVQPLFITIDPDNDTVDVVADYVGHFHPSVVGLTGDPRQIAAAAEAFNVTYGGTDDDSTEIYHSSYLYLMDEDGSFLDVFGYGAKAETIVEAIDDYLSPMNDPLIIDDAWASEAVGAGTSTVAGFMCFRNDRSSPVRIIGAASSSVDRVEIHAIVHEQGVVRMKKLDGLEVPANGEFCLEPDGTHFMLIGIDDTVKAGADIVLELETASGDKFEAVLPQRPLVNAD